jgi:hypothetical protein
MLHDVEAFVALSPKQQRMVYNALANSALEGYQPTAEAVTLLCEFVTGAIDQTVYMERLLARLAPACRPQRSDS